MTFTYQRSYRGKLQAAIFDWAGTVLDFGCLAPAVIFIEGFRREGVDITVGEAREPMGAHKRVHIEKITQMEPVRQRWIAKHGKAPTDADVERMYQAFIPLQIAMPVGLFDPHPRRPGHHRQAAGRGAARSAPPPAIPPR